MTGNFLVQVTIDRNTELKKGQIVFVIMVLSKQRMTSINLQLTFTPFPPPTLASEPPGLICSDSCIIHQRYLRGACIRTGCRLWAFSQLLALNHPLPPLTVSHKSPLPFSHLFKRKGDFPLERRREFESIHII